MPSLDDIKQLEYRVYIEELLNLRVENEQLRNKLQKKLYCAYGLVAFMTLWIFILTFGGFLLWFQYCGAANVHNGFGAHRSDTPLYPQRTSQCQLSMQQRIMNGKEDPPYTVASWHANLFIKRLVYMDGIFVEDQIGQCSGVLLDEKTILTSAHCLAVHTSNEHGKVKRTVPYGNGWNVFAGFEEKQQAQDGARRIVHSHSTYPIYEFQKNNVHDVALVFTEPFLMNLTVSYIGLPLSTDPKLHGIEKWDSCQLSGSGQILKDDGQGCYSPNTKKYMAGYFISRDCCEASRTHAVGGNSQPYEIGTVCFRSTSAMGCNGDSGGGITCTNKNKERKVVALHQGGPDCCDSLGLKINDPQEKVATYLSPAIVGWIKSEIQIYNAKWAPQPKNA